VYTRISLVTHMLLNLPE